MQARPHDHGGTSNSPRAPAHPALKTPGLKAEQRDLRRSAIVGAARDLFQTQGYAAVSMSQISARIGGSKGTLYSHFESKEQLFAAVVNEHCQTFQVFLDINPAGLALDELLHQLGRGYIELMLSDEVLAFQRLAASESARIPAIGKALYDAGRRRGHERLSALFAKLASDGVLRGDDPARAASQFMDLCVGDLLARRLWALDDITPAEVRSNVDAAIATFIRAWAA